MYLMHLKMSLISLRCRCKIILHIYPTMCTSLNTCVK